jgi:hypothetical protein
VVYSGAVRTTAAPHCGAQWLSSARHGGLRAVPPSATLPPVRLQVSDRAGIVHHTGTDWLIGCWLTDGWTDQVLTGRLVAG